MQYTALIVDDESRARKVLTLLIEEYCPHVDILGEANNLQEAIKKINSLKPNIVFLDIEMPGMSGLQLYEFYDEIDFSVIFTTAYSDFAIQAIKLSAIDYLLKPIQGEELQLAVNKVVQTRPQMEQIEALKDNINPENTIKKIGLPSSNGLNFIATDQIIYLQADGSYTNFFLLDGSKMVVSKKIKAFDFLQQDESFFRTHRSFIVNLNHIKRVSKTNGGTIVMNNSHELSIAKDKKDQLLQTLNTIGFRTF
ncbi:MAG: response regulator transcription factor [Cyclobacteriaceae bacterium]|nr:response regulator transcription factor [Cyclobacteriaceae bacterium]